MKIDKTSAVIYCRVSSQRQVDEGHGLDSQEKLCRNYANSMEYEVLRVFREEGESGGLFERPAMKQVLAFLDENNSNDENDKIIVVFDDLKRFARDVEIHFGLKKEIYGRNARIESPNFKFEDTPEGKFVETMMAASAELERSQNKRQVMQKMKARIEQGYWPFMPPLGLKNEKDPIRGKVLHAQEPYASILKKAIEKYSDGILITQEDVRQFLNDSYATEGLQNKTSLHTVQRILKNYLYAGYIEYEPWGVPFSKGQHEGFISLETFNRAQERLQSRTKPWQRHDYSSDFPLRNHVLCDACGKPLTASWAKGKKKRFPYYYCHFKGCTYNWKSVKKTELESQFERILEELKPLNEILDLARNVLLEQWDIGAEQEIENRQKMSTEMGAIDQAVKSYFDRICKTKDEDLVIAYEEEIKKLNSKKRQLESNLSKKRHTTQEFKTAAEKVFNVLKNPLSMWRSEDYNDKRTILFMYFDEEIRYNHETGFRTPRLAYPIRVINNNYSSQFTSVEMPGIGPGSKITFLKTSTSLFSAKS